MSTAIPIVIGIIIGTFFIAAPTFLASFFNAKKTAKAGPVVISVTGDLGLSYKELMVIFSMSWGVAISTAVATAITMVTAGQSDVMKWSLVAAGVAQFIFARKALLNKALRKLQMRNEQYPN